MFFNNVPYNVELGICLGYIENIVEPHDTAIVMGDFNFERLEDNAALNLCKSAFDQLNHVLCDDKVSSANPVTYVSGPLGCSSFIDHCFVSNSLRHCLCAIDIIDSAINLSDHRPVIAGFFFEHVLCEQRINRNDRKVPRRFLWRWDDIFVCM